MPSESKRKATYDEGFIDGTANEKKRQYWSNESAAAAILAASVISPHTKTSVVPEHTTQDGVIIEEHTEEDPVEQNTQ